MTAPAPESVLKASPLRYKAGGGIIAQANGFQVMRGDHVLLLGPSGSGKTTLLHLLAGLLSPADGVIDRHEAGVTGMVYQNIHLIPHLTVADNIALAGLALERKIPPARLAFLLSRLGLCGMASRKAHSLSRGEAQRVAIARALAPAPDLILADEPTAALDDENARRVAELLISMAAENQAALIIATHDHRIAPLFTRRWTMKDGVLNTGPDA